MEYTSEFDLQIWSDFTIEVKVQERWTPVRNLWRIRRMVKLLTEVAFSKMFLIEELKIELLWPQLVK